MTDPLTYGSYLAALTLLALQHPRSEGPEHDEMLFIVIHQVYELWFKAGAARGRSRDPAARAGEPHRAQHTLKRILTILKVLVAQLDILETMTPLEFQSFRERLEAASGFQSDQFRQLEFVLGNKSRARSSASAGRTRAIAALEGFLLPTLWDASSVSDRIEGSHAPGARSPGRDRADRAVAETPAADHGVSARIPSTRSVRAAGRPRRGLQEWRYRHVKMVQRTIGAKLGRAVQPCSRLLEPQLVDLVGCR